MGGAVVIMKTELYTESTTRLLKYTQNFTTSQDTPKEPVEIRAMAEEAFKNNCIIARQP